MPDNQVTLRVFIDQLQESLSGLRSLSEGQKQFAEASGAAGTASEEMSSQMDGLFGRITGLLNPTTLLAGAIGVGLTGALAGAVSSFKDFALEVRNLSVESGDSAEDVSVLLNGLEALSVNTDYAKIAITMMSRAIEAGSPALNKMRISVLDASGAQKSALTIMYEAIDGLASMTNATERTNDARSLFGRGWMQLLPALAAGSEKIKELGENAGKMITQADIKSAQDYQIALHELHEVIEATGISVGRDLVPPLVALFVTLEPVVKIVGTSLVFAVKAALAAVMLLGSAVLTLLTPIAAPLAALTDKLGITTGAYKQWMSTLSGAHELMIQQSDDAYSYLLKQLGLTDQLAVAQVKQTKAAVEGLNVISARQAVAVAQTQELITKAGVAAAEAMVPGLAKVQALAAANVAQAQAKADLAIAQINEKMVKGDPAASMAEMEKRQAATILEQTALVSAAKQKGAQQVAQAVLASDKIVMDSATKTAKADADAAKSVEQIQIDALGNEADALKQYHDLGLASTQDFAARSSQIEDAKLALTLSGIERERQANAEAVQNKLDLSAREAKIKGTDAVALAAEFDSIRADGAAKDQDFLMKETKAVDDAAKKQFGFRVEGAKAFREAEQAIQAAGLEVEIAQSSTFTGQMLTMRKSFGDEMDKLANKAEEHDGERQELAVLKWEKYQADKAKAVRDFLAKYVGYGAEAYAAAVANIDRDYEDFLNATHNKVAADAMRANAMRDLRNKELDETQKQRWADLDDYKKGLARHSLDLENALKGEAYLKAEAALKDQQTAEAVAKAKLEYDYNIRQSALNTSLYQAELAGDWSESMISILRLQSTQWRSNTTQWMDAFKGFLDDTHKGFTTTFEDLFTGKLKTFSDFWKSIWNDLKTSALKALAQIVSDAIWKQLMSQLLGIFGLGSGGLLGATGALLGGASGVGTLDYLKDYYDAITGAKTLSEIPGIVGAIASGNWGAVAEALTPGYSLLSSGATALGLGPSAGFAPDSFFGMFSTTPGAASAPEILAGLYGAGAGAEAGVGAGAAAMGGAPLLGGVEAGAGAGAAVGTTMLSADVLGPIGFGIAALTGLGFGIASMFEKGKTEEQVGQDRLASYLNEGTGPGTSRARMLSVLAGAGASAYSQFGDAGGGMAGQDYSVAIAAVAAGLLPAGSPSVFRDIGQELYAALQASYSPEQLAWLAAGGAPGSQFGGNVWAGEPTVVGEAGRELLLPWENGMVVPNAATERMLGGGGGGVSVSVTVTGNTFARDMDLYTVMTNTSNEMIRRLKASRGFSWH